MSVLHGAVVVEVGGGIAASYAGMLLRAAGATVVRHEVDAGSWRDTGSWSSPSERAYVAALDRWLNRGKETVAYPDVGALAAAIPHVGAAADVVIDDLGEGRDELSPFVRDGSPPTTWVVVTPFGLDERWGSGSELTAAAMSAAIWAIGRPEAEPLNIPHGQTAVQGGVVAASLAAAAIVGGGEPRVIEVSWCEVISSYAATNASLFVWEREGHRAARSGGAYPYTILPCKDGSVCLAARSNGEWRRIIAALDDPAWASDERYRDVRRIAVECPDEVDALLIATLGRFTRDQLLDRAIAHGCTIAPVRTFQDLVRDRDLRIAGAIVDDVAPVPALTWFKDACA